MSPFYHTASVPLASSARHREAAYRILMLGAVYGVAVYVAVAFSPNTGPADNGNGDIPPSSAFLSD